MWNGAASVGFAEDVRRLWLTICHNPDFEGTCGLTNKEFTLSGFLSLDDSMMADVQAFSRERMDLAIFFSSIIKSEWRSYWIH